MKTQNKLVIALVIALIVLLGFAWYTRPQAVPPAPTETTPTPLATSTMATSTSTVDASYPAPSLGEQRGVITIGGQTIYVDLAVNQAQQELGLGNRASLGASQGMLFVFPDDEQHMFWMKDMSFSIDMVWMSANGTIIYIQPNVAPSTYPAAFGPKGLSRYVLELPANFAASNGIKVGDKATLP